MLAKGTFNNLAQLESVLATAERRRRAGALVGGGLRQDGRAGSDRRGARLAGGRHLAPRASWRGSAPGCSAATVGGVVAKAVKPGEADAFHFCGHTFTTGSCIHPLGLPRVDARGYPIRPSDGRPVDNIGRLVNERGLPIHEDGERSSATPTGCRCRRRREPRSATQTAKHYGIEAHLQGAWYRCCGGTVRKLWDCCSHHDRRINGDAALHGYCYGSRKVFCVTYYQTHVPC